MKELSSSGSSNDGEVATGRGVGHRSQPQAGGAAAAGHPQASLRRAALPQNPADEPASVLLARIRAEKGGGKKKAADVAAGGEYQ